MDRGYSPRGHIELDMAERLTLHFLTSVRYIRITRRSLYKLLNQACSGSVKPDYLGWVWTLVLSEISPGDLNV